MKKTTDQKINSNETYDSFLRAFTMIQASSAAGISFFNRKRLQKELHTYMQDLHLLHFEEKSQDEKDAIIAEWTEFACAFINSCTGSKAYCSTLFGMVPIKDAAVAEKIASDIDLVTRAYPANFDMEKEFEPFRKTLMDVYHQTLEL